MRIILATNHLFGWTGSEITLAIIANALKSGGHEVLVYSDYYSNKKLIDDLMPNCSFTNSLPDVQQYRPHVAYTQHHSTALNIRSVCPKTPIAHAILGVLPHLEKLPPFNLGVNYYLPISEEVASTLSEEIGKNAVISIFRNIVDDEQFSPVKPSNVLGGICCYSYKISDQKFCQLSIAATEHGLDIFDHRTLPGSIPYKDVPKLLAAGEVVVASGRGAIEAMLCGKVPLIISDCGDDGLVTPDNFEQHMRTNFSGRTTARNFDVETIGMELDRYDPSYGSKLQELASHYFGLRARRNQLFEIFETLSNVQTDNISKEQYGTIKFLSKTFELQRIFAIDELKLRADVSGEAFQPCEARLFFSEIVEGAPQNYSEFRSEALLYPISKQRQTIYLPLPADLKPIAGIRLDLSHRPVAVLLHRLSVVKADGAELWQWDGTVQLFRNMGGLAMCETFEGLLILCWDNDPQFDLVLPNEVLVSLQPNACLVIEITPRPLLEVCAEILSRDNRLIADLRTAATGNSIVDATATHAEAQYPLPGLSEDLERVSSLLMSSLARRDQTIVEQSIQIRAMRDELLRAEVQLDLLKDIMIGGRESDQL